MSTEELVRGRGKIRALITAEVPEHLKEPKPEWAYKRSLKPTVLARDLWQGRHIVGTIVERNLRVRYKQSILGFAWAIITPLGLLFVFTFVFGRIARVDTGSVPYPLFAYVGLLAWTFFAAGLTTGGNSLLSDKALLNKSQFPREVFPLANITVSGVDAITAMIPLAALFVINSYAPAITTPLAILPILVLLPFTIGLSLALAVTIVYLRDFRQALPLILQVGLFATPIAYGLDLVPQWARMAYCFVNPVAPVIDSLRRTVLLGSAPQWGYLGAGAITSLVVFFAGYAVFKKFDGGVTDVA